MFKDGGKSTILSLFFNSSIIKILIDTNKFPSCFLGVPCWYDGLWASDYPPG